ncbi:MAG: Xenobiotic-transporting ATPase Peptide-transporting ATPase [Thermoleophilia bacterium]|nr:Xenobiotic-transporting ATPase Peptide-transporting ATPase [Thermoleophilia bacterium]
MTTAPPRTTPLPTAPDGGWKAFRRLLGFWRPFKRQVITSFALAYVMVALGLLGPFLMGRAIDDIKDRNWDDISTDALLLVGAALAVAIISASRRVVSGLISLGIEQHLRDKLFVHLSGLGFRFFATQQTGQLLSRVTSDVTQVRFFLGYGLTYFFQHSAKIVAIPIVLWFVEPRLAVIVYVMMPLIVVLSVRFSRRSHPILKEAQQKLALVTAHGEETIVGARVVRAFGQEDREIERFRLLTQDVVQQERRAMIVRARYQPLYDLIPQLTVLVIVYVAARSVNSGSMTFGSFVAFYGYVFMLTSPLRIIGGLLNRAQRATASGQRLWDLLDADDRIPAAEHPTAVPHDPETGSGLRFEGVSFGYRAGRRVLDDVTLEIQPGETIALLGPTGCGKTTLASMVPRFYDPEVGRVLLGGVDLRELDLHELRRSIGLVDQEPFLFSASIRDNLRYGNPGATDDDVWRAIDAAQARGFVERLPEGVDTVVGERGLTLSGGQRQRLAIARALVVDPQVLILDDATASVDSEVEARISDALGSASRKRTTIIIAHRPSTIALADRIVVMREGRIEDVGTHDELIARNQTYQLVFEQKAARREFLLDQAHEPSRPEGEPV